MPKTTVAALVTRQEGGAEQLLLTRRAVEPFKGRWCLPGGHIDDYEPARAAAAREVREETSLGFDPVFFGYFDEIIREMQIHAVVLAFHGGASGELAPSADEVLDAGWFTLDQALALELAFQHGEIIAAYARRGRTDDRQ